jgi:hypothetical protein
LLSPEIDEIESKPAVESKDTVYRVIIFAVAHREVACTVEPEPLRWRDVERRDNPLVAKIGTFLGGGRQPILTLVSYSSNVNVTFDGSS